MVLGHPQPGGQVAWCVFIEHLLQLSNNYTTKVLCLSKGGLGGRRSLSTTRPSHLLPSMSTTNNRRSVSPASSAPYIDRPPIRMGFDPSQPGASPPVWPPIPVSNAPYIDPPPIRMGFGPSEPGPSPRILPPIRFRFQGGEFADTTRRSNAAVMPSLARPYGE